MSLSVIEFLRHIYDEIIYLQNESKDLTFEEFINNPTLTRAFSRSPEIIGEAVKKIPEELKIKYPEIELSTAYNNFLVLNFYHQSTLNAVKL